MIIFVNFNMFYFLGTYYTKRHDEWKTINIHLQVKFLNHLYYQ